MSNGIPFWMVWHDGGDAPTSKHSNYGSAEREAERLAGINPGRSFCVMACVSRVTKKTVEIERFDLDADDNIPF